MQNLWNFYNIGIQHQDYIEPKRHFYPQLVDIVRQLQSCPLADLLSEKFDGEIQEIRVIYSLYNDEE